MTARHRHPHRGQLDGQPGDEVLDHPGHRRVHRQAVPFQQLIRTHLYCLSDEDVRRLEEPYVPHTVLM